MGLLADDHIKKESLKGISVYDYTDYRKFLLDFYQMKKDSSRGYSYRLFSKAAGFSSPNFLKLVIEGQRNITSVSVVSFCLALGLKGSAADYFKTLVLLNQSEKLDDKLKYYEILRKIPPASRQRIIDDVSLEYLSHWLYPVLREMAVIDGFSDDPHWIARRIVGEASLKDIKKALKFLLDNHFITKESDGTYKSVDQVVTSTDEVRSMAIRQFHRVMLEQAMGTLDTLPVESREFGAITVKLSLTDLAELKQKIKVFRSEIHRWALNQSEDFAKDQVIQVNIQMYPQTKRG